MLEQLVTECQHLLDGLNDKWIEVMPNGGEGDKEGLMIVRIHPPSTVRSETKIRLFLVKFTRPDAAVVSPMS